MTLDLTSFDPMLKDHYAPGVVANLAYARNKALGMLRKSNKKQAGGRKWVQPIGFALPGGGSSTFATANAASINSLHDAFEVPHASHYRVPKVANNVIEQTADGDEDAFEPAFDEFDKAIKAEANWINHRFFRSRGGAVGRSTTATNVATAVMQLSDPADTWQVRKDDVCQLSDTDGTSGAVRAGTITVLSVNRKAGTITFTGNITAGIAAAVNTDFLFLNGDFGLAPAGLADWIPDTDAGAATTLFSCARASDPEMLGGRRVDLTGGNSIADGIVDMVTEYDEMGGEGDMLTLFINPRAAGSLSKQLEGRWQIVQASGAGGAKMASIGYKTWTVTVEGHEVHIVTERSCPSKRLYLLQMDTWTMFVAGQAPNFLTRRAGSIIKVSENSDGYEARVGEYMNFACSAPGYNVVGLLP